MELRSKVWLLHKGKMVFGRGRAELLEAIGRTGSISAAARELELSYRHAWPMIRARAKRLGAFGTDGLYNPCKRCPTGQGCGEASQAQIERVMAQAGPDAYI